MSMMDAEADQLCGGETNSRNGYRERSLATCVGTLTLRIPKLRTGSFFPDDVIEKSSSLKPAILRLGTVRSHPDYCRSAPSIFPSAPPP